MMRISRVALILLLFMSISMPVQASEVPLLMSAKLIKEVPSEGAAYEEALAAAKKEWEAFDKDSKSDAEPYIMSTFLSLELDGKNETAWFFTFRYFDMERPDFEAVVLSPSNKVVLAEQYTWQERQLAWEAVNEELFNFWSLEDKALFYTMYFVDPNPEAHYMSMPGNDDLTEEQALQIARDALIDYGVSPDQIDAAKVSVNFWVWINSPANEETWILTYYEPDHIEDASDNVYQVNLRKDGTPFVVYDLYQDGPQNG